MKLIRKHLRLTLHTRAMNLEGELTGTIIRPGKWWVDFQGKLRALGFTVEQVSSDGPQSRGTNPEFNE